MIHYCIWALVVTIFIFAALAVVLFLIAAFLPINEFILVLIAESIIIYLLVLIMLMLNDKRKGK